MTLTSFVSCRPLEVIGHDGKSHNVTMVPGDLVLYESHSVIHGKLFKCGSEVFDVMRYFNLP